LKKRISLQINAFIFLKNLHNPEVGSSNLPLATEASLLGSLIFLL